MASNDFVLTNEGWALIGPKRGRSENESSSSSEDSDSDGSMDSEEERALDGDFDDDDSSSSGSSSSDGDGGSDSNGSSSDDDGSSDSDGSGSNDDEEENNSLLELVEQYRDKFFGTEILAHTSDIAKKIFENYDSGSLTQLSIPFYGRPHLTDEIERALKNTIRLEIASLDGVCISTYYDCTFLKRLFEASKGYLYILLQPGAKNIETNPDYRKKRKEYEDKVRELLQVPVNNIYEQSLRWPLAGLIEELKKSVQTVKMEVIDDDDGPAPTTVISRENKKKRGTPKPKGQTKSKGKVKIAKAKPTASCSWEEAPDLAKANQCFVAKLIDNLGFQLNSHEQAQRQFATFVDLYNKVDSEPGIPDLLKDFENSRLTRGDLIMKVTDRQVLEQRLNNWFENTVFTTMAIPVDYQPSIQKWKKSREDQLKAHILLYNKAIKRDDLRIKEGKRRKLEEEKQKIKSDENKANWMKICKEAYKIRYGEFIAKVIKWKNSSAGVAYTDLEKAINQFVAENAYLCNKLLRKRDGKIAKEIQLKEVEDVLKNEFDTRYRESKYQVVDGNYNIDELIERVQKALLKHSSSKGEERGLFSGLTNIFNTKPVISASLTNDGYSFARIGPPAPPKSPSMGRRRVPAPPPPQAEPEPELEPEPEPEIDVNAFNEGPDQAERTPIPYDLQPGGGIPTRTYKDPSSNWLSVSKYFTQSCDAQAEEVVKSINDYFEKSILGSEWKTLLGWICLQARKIKGKDGSASNVLYGNVSVTLHQSILRYFAEWLEDKHDDMGKYNETQKDIRNYCLREGRNGEEWQKKIRCMFKEKKAKINIARGVWSALFEHNYSSDVTWNLWQGSQLISWLIQGLKFLTELSNLGMWDLVIVQFCKLAIAFCMGAPMYVVKKIYSTIQNIVKCFPSWVSTTTWTIIMGSLAYFIYSGYSLLSGMEIDAETIKATFKYIGKMNSALFWELVPFYEAYRSRYPSDDQGWLTMDMKMESTKNTHGIKNMKFIPGLVTHVLVMLSSGLLVHSRQSSSRDEVPAFPQKEFRDLIKYDEKCPKGWGDLQDL